MADAGFEMVRYADDVVILCRTADEAAAALATVQRWTAAAGLRLHPEKTHLVDMQAPGGVDFLGYHFERHYRVPRKKSLRKLRRRGTTDDASDQRAEPRGPHRRSESDVGGLVWLFQTQSRILRGSGRVDPDAAAGSAP
jgi:hypothetical protein